MHNLCDRLESERGSGQFTPISTRLVASSATRAGVSCTTTSGDDSARYQAEDARRERGRQGQPRITPR